MYVRESLELYIESLTGFKKDMSVRLMIAFCNTTSSIDENHYTPPLVYMLVPPVCKCLFVYPHKDMSWVAF